MRIFLLGLGSDSMKEQDPLANDSLNSADTICETIISYMLGLQNAHLDKLIIFSSPDTICDSGNVNLLTRFFTNQSARKETSFQSDFLSFNKRIEEICENKGVSPPIVDLISISDDAKNAWEIFEKVKKMLEESGVPAEDTCIMSADASSYTPITYVLSMITQLFESEGYKVDRLSVDTQNSACHLTDPAVRITFYDAICEFVNTGRSEKPDGNINDPLMTDLLEQLDRFAEDLNLCQAEDLEETLFKIYEIIGILGTRGESDNFSRSLYGKLTSLFGNSMPQLSTTVYIECCLRWKWLTQCLIIFIDALPREIHQKKIIMCDISSVNNAIQTPETELLYTYLTNSPVPKEEEIKELLSSFLHGQLGDDSKSLFIEEFAEIIKRFEKSMNDNDLTIPYNGIDHLTSYSNDENEGVDQIIQFIQNNDLATMSQFKRRLAANIDEFEYFYKDQLRFDENLISKKILGVKYFSLQHLRKTLKGFRLNIDYSHLSDLRKFIGYYLYIKHVRNNVSHASVFRRLDDKLNTDQKRELSRLGIDTGEVTAGSISRNISAALNCLKKCLITQRKPTVKKYYMAFPIFDTFDDIHVQLHSLFANVSNYDNVNVYVMNNKAVSDETEMIFIREMNKYAIQNDFFINVEKINCSEPSELLNKLSLTVKNGDKISADCTDMTGIQIITMTLFLKMSAEKDADIENVICKENCLTDLINSQFKKT